MSGALETDYAHAIRAALDDVVALRHSRIGQHALGAAVSTVKQFQARRFEGSYADLLADSAYSRAARFFLDELYGDQDFADRDAQFARIAGAMERLLPQSILATVVMLARLHAQTERLDHAMGLAWVAVPANRETPVARYLQAWRAVGQRQQRESQLEAVMRIGHSLARLTATPGLRLLLKAMRGPAAAGGLAALQHFLEAGFDTFAGLARRKEAVDHFLATIQGRESELIRTLFEAERETAESHLRQLLGQLP